MEKQFLSEKKIYTRFIGYSFALHLFLFLFFLIVSIFQQKVISPEKEIMWVQLGSSGTQEGLPIKESKTLPKTTIQEQKKGKEEQPPPKQVKKEELKVKKEVKQNVKEKVAIQDKNKKPKKEEKKETKKEEVKSSKEDSKIKEALKKINDDLKEKSVPPEAAQAKQGGSGDPAGNPEKGGSNSECGRYSARVRQRIVSNWIRLIGSNRPPRSPKISVMINANGEIISTPQWIQKSGDYSLDASTLRAVQTSSPFPPPPVDCQEAVKEGFVVVFGK